jgi:ubiquinone/menaquinone biosynthesis C-methylase UbiE
VPRHQLRLGEPSGAGTTDVRERRIGHEENVAHCAQPSGEIDVLEPELEVLVPPADGFEGTTTDEQACTGRLIDGDDGVLVEVQGSPRSSKERCSQRDGPWKRPGEIELLRPSVGGIDEPPRRGHGLTPHLERRGERRDRMIRREHVIVQKQNEFRRTRRGTVVVREGQSLGALDAHDIDVGASPPNRVRRTVRGAVVDDNHAFEQRRAQVLDAVEHQLPRILCGDDRIDHGRLIPSASVTEPETASYDANLRSGPQMLMYRKLADKLARRNPGRVLDWGCGWGQVTMLLRERGVNVTAFDFREGLEGTTTSPLERFPEIEAHLSSDPVALPFDDHSFDTVLSCGVLEHVPDPDGSVQEIHRVLRPGGTFYVTNLPNRYSYTERIARLLGLYYHGRLPDDRVYTASSAKELLARHGFVVQEFRRVHMVPLTLGGPARLIWGVSSALQRVPVVNAVATSLELTAIASGEIGDHAETAARDTRSAH